MKFKLLSSKFKASQKQLRPTLPAKPSLLSSDLFWAGAFLVAQSKEPTCNAEDAQDTQARSLGGEDPLEKETATHSIILAWKIPWTEGPGELRSMGSQVSQTQLSNETSTNFWTSPERTPQLQTAIPPFVKPSLMSSPQHYYEILTIPDYGIIIPIISVSHTTVDRKIT